MSETDSNLRDLALTGDKEALGRLLLRHSPAIRRRLTQIVAREPPLFRRFVNEDDILQETLADASAAIAQFTDQGEHSFAGWLRTIAERNLADAIRAFRSRKRGAGLEGKAVGAGSDSASGFDPPGTVSRRPSLMARRREAARMLTDALADLPEKDRKVIELYDLQGMPMKKVAESLGTTVGAVFTRRGRVLRVLEEALGRRSDFIFE